MGFKTQRQYQTSINSYEAVKEAVWINKAQVVKCDLSPENEKGNFTFYLRKYPSVRIQITSKQLFLKLHGLKPHKFLLDLKVISEFTSLLGDFYPHGIDFKLDKESYNYYDKDEIIKELEEINDLLKYMLHTAINNPEIFCDFIDGIWKDIDNDVILHNYFAEQGNNFYAKVLCESGFRCKPDGSIKYRANKPSDPLLKQSTRILLKSGFLEERRARW